MLRLPLRVKPREQRLLRIKSRMTFVIIAPRVVREIKEIGCLVLLRSRCAVPNAYRIGVSEEDGAATVEPTGWAADCYDTFDFESVGVEAVHRRDADSAMALIAEPANEVDPLADKGGGVEVGRCRKRRPGR